MVFLFSLNYGVDEETACGPLLLPIFPPSLKGRYSVATMIMGYSDWTFFPRLFLLETISSFLLYEFASILWEVSMVCLGLPPPLFVPFFFLLPLPRPLITHTLSSKSSRSDRPIPVANSFLSSPPLFFFFSSFLKFRPPLLLLP